MVLTDINGGPIVNSHHQGPTFVGNLTHKVAIESTFHCATGCLIIKEDFCVIGHGVFVNIPLKGHVHASVKVFDLSVRHFLIGVLSFYPWPSRIQGLLFVSLYIELRCKLYCTHLKLLMELFLDFNLHSQSVSHLHTPIQIEMGRQLIKIINEKESTKKK